MLEGALPDVVEIAREGQLLGARGEPQIDLGGVPLLALVTYSAGSPGVARLETVQGGPSLVGDGPDHSPGPLVRRRDQVGFARPVEGGFVEHQAIVVEVAGAHGPSARNSFCQAAAAEVRPIGEVEFAHRGIIAENRIGLQP